MTMALSRHLNGEGALAPRSQRCGAGGGLTNERERRSAFRRRPDYALMSARSMVNLDTNAGQPSLTPLY